MLSRQREAVHANLEGRSSDSKLLKELRDLQLQVQEGEMKTQRAENRGEKMLKQMLEGWGCEQRTGGGTSWGRDEGNMAKTVRNTTPAQNVSLHLSQQFVQLVY